MRINKKILVAAIISVFIALGVLFFIASPEESDSIYTHIYIHGVPVGGLTVVEAEAALMERFQPGLENKTLKYSVNGEIVTAFTFADFGARFDFSGLVQEAMNYSVLGSLQSRIERMFGRSYKIDTHPGLVIAPERMESILSGLSRQIDMTAKNASFSLENGNVIITPESTGRAIDIQAATLATHRVLNSLTDGIVELTIQATQPVYTSTDFTFDVSVLGAFQTKYTGTDADPRIYNVRLAARKVNNQVIYPGEIFSTGAIIGAHKPNSGFKSAIVLVRGEPVEDIGGGVCQVVSTLYNAVLAAELTIVQRHNHSVPVSYVENGFDATVAGDYYDLKFKNNTPHPILISSQMAGGNLSISIHGHENRPANRNIRFSAKHIETIKPEAYREVVDPAIPRDERHITLEPQPGYHVELHKHVYVDGKEVEVVKINTSIYKPLQGVIAIGAG